MYYFQLNLTSIFSMYIFFQYEYDNGMFGLGDSYQDTCGTIVYNTTNVNGTVVNTATYVGSNCMAMLSFQVLTVMIIKPFPKLAKDVLVP